MRIKSTTCLYTQEEVLQSFHSYFPDINLVNRIKGDCNSWTDIVVQTTLNVQTTDTW